MKKNLFTLLLTGITILAPLSAEGAVDFSGEIKTKWGIAAPWTDKDSSAARFLLGDTSFTATLDAYYDNSSAFAEASVSYDAVQIPSTGL